MCSVSIGVGQSAGGLHQAIAVHVRRVDVVWELFHSEVVWGLLERMTMTRVVRAGGWLGTVNRLRCFEWKVYRCLMLRRS